MTNETAANVPLTTNLNGDSGLFKWICLCAAAIATGLFAWMVNDVRLELKQSTTIVNDNLPIILEQTRTSTETLATLSEDLREFRDLAGAAGPRDDTLVTYADEILDLVQGQTSARIGVEKLIGSSLDDPRPAVDWVADARKEAVLQTLRSATRFELLNRLCHNRFGSPWRIQFGDDEPVLLMEWMRDNHAETGEIISDNEESTVDE